jgi:hypothetical protein
VGDFGFWIAEFGFKEIEVMSEVRDQTSEKSKRADSDFADL